MDLGVALTLSALWRLEVITLWVYLVWFERNYLNRMPCWTDVAVHSLLSADWSRSVGNGVLQGFRRLIWSKSSPVYPPYLEGR